MRDPTHLCNSPHTGRPGYRTLGKPKPGPLPCGSPQASRTPTSGFQPAPLYTGKESHVTKQRDINPSCMLLAPRAERRKTPCTLPTPRNGPRCTQPQWTVSQMNSWEGLSHSNWGPRIRSIPGDPSRGPLILRCFPRNVPRPSANGGIQPHPVTKPMDPERPITSSFKPHTSLARGQTTKHGASSWN